MASYSKSGKGWHASVAVRGTRDTKTFSTKAEAVAWAAARETEIRSGVNAGPGESKTLDDAFNRYLREVSVHKRGHRMERHRLAAIADHVVAGRRLGSLRLADVSSDILGQWRDLRLRGTAAANFEDKVLGASVIRELNLLSHVFTTARREWKWIAKSPTTDVRRPKGSAPRDRRISQDEIDRLCVALGFDEAPVSTKSGAVAVAFLFAIETAMRAGEICGLKRSDIKGRVAHLPRTKNGTKRDVPLSSRALDLIALMPPGDMLFGISAARLDALFRKAKERCQIEDLKFHDPLSGYWRYTAQRRNPALRCARAKSDESAETIRSYLVIQTWRSGVSCPVVSHCRRRAVHVPSAGGGHIQAVDAGGDQLAKQINGLQVGALSSDANEAIANDGRAKAAIEDAEHQAGATPVEFRSIFQIRCGRTLRRLCLRAITACHTVMATAVTAMTILPRASVSVDSML